MSMLYKKNCTYVHEINTHLSGIIATVITLLARRHYLTNHGYVITETLTGLFF